MGRATRWLRNLLGGGGGGGKKSAADPKSVSPSTPAKEKEKKRWKFGKSFREVADKPVAPRASHPPPPPPAVVGDPDEQSRRAIAVAAATAAVAEAAVAAAHAAAAVVRLTSTGAAAAVPRSVAGTKKELWAAVKIQAAFRGYLARRALKALRGLVKLQALVRGNIVRKQAAEVLRGMHALVRVQARARAYRALHSHPECPSQRAHPSPPTPEKYEEPAGRNGSRSDRPAPIKRSSSKSSGSERLIAGGGSSGGRERSQSCGRNWLDRWMEEKYVDDDRNTKILEVDTGRPRHGSTKRRSSGGQHHSSCSTMTSDPNSRSFATVMDSPSPDSVAAQLSPPSVGTGRPNDTGICDVSPQFLSASSRMRGPFTPAAKSECAKSLFSGYSECPNYMANTESSRAKARSHSAPRQRPEFDKPAALLRRVPSQADLSPAASVVPPRAAWVNGKAAYHGSGRLDRYGMPIRH